MKKDWLWDKDISEKELNEVFANRNNPRFVSLAALLLSRKNSAGEVFKEYIKREDFFVRWHSIKRRMRKNSWNDPRIEYWQAIYDTLKKIPEVAELKQPRSSVLQIQEEPLFALPREIGEKIRETREKSGLTQKKLADKLGISQQIISRIETGMHNISLETLDKVCRSLGMPINAEKLGLQVEPETIDKTLNVLPFSAKSPDEFVKAVYEIIDRLKVGTLKEFDRVQYYDGMGDKQRDIIAYKYEVGTKQQWYFQCKRYTKKIGFSIFKEEVNKIAEHSRKDKDYRPDVIVFVTACLVGIPTRDKVKGYAKKIGLEEVIFWTDIELTAKAKAAGIYDDLFPVTYKNLKESSEDIKKHVMNLFSNAGLLIEQDKSKNDEIKQNLGINDVLVQIERRNFETAYNMLIAFKEWAKLSYKEKTRLAHIFFFKGAPQQAKNILKTLESEAEQKKDIQFWIDMSLNEVLLDDKNKNLAIKAAEKAKDFSIGTDKEKMVISHFNAIILRYAPIGEVDRLMEGMFDYDRKYPDDKIIRPIKAIDEKGGLSDDFKTMLLKQKEWYEGVKRTFRNQPVASYYLEQILRRPYAQILSFQNDPEFVIELTIPNEQFEKELFDNFAKAEQLVFDYASLLNLSKMNLLGYLERFGKQLYITKELFDKLQDELLMFEQEDLRRLWRFLMSSKEIGITEEFNVALKEENVDKLFDKWLVDSMKLVKEKNAVFVVDDLRLLRFLSSEDIKGCNSYIILKAIRSKGWIDEKMYSLSLGDLAERFYTFLPFSGDNLFQIVLEDKSKITLRSYHLINQLFLPGSIVESFTKVFVKFIDLLWRTGSLPEDKVKWLGFLSEKILECIDKQGGVDNNQELEKVSPDFVQMWIIAVQRSNRDEVALLEKEVDKVLVKPYLAILKDNITRFIQTKNKDLTSK